MKKTRKALSLLASAALFASIMSFSASAQPNSGVDIMPITDPAYWEAQTGDNAYAELTNADAWVKTTIDEKGAITMQRTAKCAPACCWPRIRTLLEEGMPVYSLKDNPYFYYDFEAKDTKWMIQLNYGSNQSIDVKLAQAISAAQGKTLAKIDDDGEAGVYKGKIDLNKVITDAGKTAVHTDKNDFIPEIQIYIVDTGTAGTLKINSLSIGNDDASKPAGPKLDSKLKGGDDDAAADTKDTGKAATTAAGGSTVTTAAAGAKTTAAAKVTSAATKAGTTAVVTTNTQNKGSSNLWVVIVIVAVVVIGGGAAAFIIIKKKKANSVPKE